jgi:hypothetical protein
MKQFKLLPAVSIVIILTCLVRSSQSSAAGTVWHEFNGDSLNLTEFFTIEVFNSGESVRLYCEQDHTVGRDFFSPLFSYKKTYTLPDEPLTMQSDYQALFSDRPLTWDRDIQLVLSPADNIVSVYDTNHIEAMRIPAPTSLILVTIGLLSLRITRRLRY